MKRLSFLSAILLSSFLCFVLGNKSHEPAKKSDAAKKRLLTTIDDDIREYYVHVPLQYDSTKKHPVVFALVKNIEHVYPNGENHPVNGVKVHWA
jgi:hypothetical protein